MISLSEKRQPLGVLPAGLVICCFVIYPIIKIFLMFPLSTGVLPDRGTLSALGNTIKVGIITVLSTLAVSSPIAWLVARTDLPGKSLIRKLAWLTFAVPAYILGIAWMELMGRNGYLHRLLSHNREMMDWDFPYYSLTAVILVLTIHLYPLVFMTLLPLFKNQDARREQAAAVSGIPPVTRFFTITLPLVFPGIAAAGLLVFSRSAANFAIPALLALPDRKEVLTTRIFSALSSLNLRDAAFLSVLLVAISWLLFLVQKRLGGRQRFSAGESPLRKQPVKLGRMKIPALTLVLLFQFLTGVLPVSALILSSFLKRWGLPLEAQYFTLHNYQALLFGGTKAVRALGNSLMFGAVATFFASMIALWVSFYAVIYPSRMSRIVEGAAGLPLAVPNIVLAVAAVLAWNNPYFPLYGSGWGIIVTYMVLFIPLILKNISGLMETFPRAYLHAARLSGASPLRSLKDILLPILIPGFESGVMVCMLIALREIPISLMLYSSGQETMGVLLFGMQSQSYGLEMTSALAIFIIVLTLSGQSLGRKIKSSIRISYAGT